MLLSLLCSFEFSEMTCMLFSFFLSFLLLYSNFPPLPRWGIFSQFPFTLDEICTVFSYHGFPVARVAVAVQYVSLFVVLEALV